MQLATTNTLLKNTQTKTCKVPDIAYFVLFILLIVSVNAKCLDCEQIYFKCRSDAIASFSQNSQNKLTDNVLKIEHSESSTNPKIETLNNKNVLKIEHSQKHKRNNLNQNQCLCVEQFLECHEENKCEYKETIKHDYDSLQCSFKIPQTIQEVDRIQISPIAFLLIFMTIFIVLTIICVIVIAIRYRKEITQKFQRIGKKDVILCNGKDDCFDEEKSLIEKEKNQNDMNELKMCKICYENKKNSVFIPCGHICCCFECAVKLDECPLCRMKIDKIVKTFDA